MPVHDPSQAAADKPFTQGYTPAPPPQAPASPYSLLNLGRVGVSRNGMSENLSKAKAQIEKVIKEKIGVTPEFELWILSADNSVHNHLKLSGLIFVLKPKDPAYKTLTFHTLLIEGPNVLPPRQTKIANGQDIAVDFFSDMVYDKGYVATVVEIIRAQQGQDINLVPVAAEVVPRTFNFDDLEAVRILATNAYIAVEQQLFHELGVPEVDLTTAARDAYIQTSVQYNQSDVMSATQLPVRADLQINVTAVSNEQASNDTVNNSKPSELLAEIAGFIEPVFAPFQNPMNAFGVQGFGVQGFGMQQQPTQKFFARLVLTRLLSQRSVSPGMQTFMLSAGLSLTENGAWWTYFRSPKGINPQGTQANRRDVGALNIEANVYNEEGGWGTPIATGDAKFGDEQLGRFLAQAMAPNLAVALDVSTCSDDTYYNDVFAYAASPGMEGDKAREALLAYADHMTGGRFRAHYSRREGKGNPVVINEEWILNGWYQRADGSRADIREVDYLAVMNVLGRQNPRMGAAWSDAMFSNQPRERNELAQKQIISDVLGANINFTGRTRRVTVMGDFMDSFRDGLRDINISFRPSNPQGQGEFFQQRGRADFIHTAAFSPNSSGLYQANYGQGNQQYAGRAFGPGQRNW